jgi:hypothetical protein
MLTFYIANILKLCFSNILHRSLYNSKRLALLQANNSTL